MPPGSMVALPPYLDPMITQVDPAMQLSPAQQAALGIGRLQSDAGMFFSEAYPATVLGTRRAFRDVSGLAQLNPITAPIATPYAPETATFGHSFLGAFGWGAEARNLTAAQYQHISQRDLAQRFAMGTSAVAVDVGVPTAAFFGGAAAGGAVGGPVGSLVGGTVASIGASMVMNSDLVRMEFQMRNLIESASGRFITGSFSSNPMGKGFTREEAGEILEHIRESGAGESFLDPEAMSGILRGGTMSGLFDAVRSTQEFKKRFDEVKEGLKTVMQTLHQSLQEGLQTLGELNNAGFQTPGQVQGFLSQAASAGNLTGVSTGVAAQNALTTAELFRGTGVRMAFGAQLAATNMEIAGTMVARGRINEETVRQLGGTLGVANAMTTMQTAMAFDNIQVRRAMMGAFRPGGALDMPEMMRFLTGEDDVFDVGSRALRNLTRGGTDYYSFLGSQSRLVSDVPEELMPLLSIAPVRNTARQMARVDARVDPNSPDFLRGVAMGIYGMDPNQADVLVSQFQEFREKGVGDVFAARYNEILQEQARERTELLPGQAAYLALRGAGQRIAGGVFDLFQRVEGFAQRQLEEIQGIHRISYRRIDRGVVRTARDYLQRQESTEGTRAARLREIQETLASIRPEGIGRAEELEVQAKDLRESPTGSVAQRRRHNSQANRLQAQAARLRREARYTEGDVELISTLTAEQEHLQARIQEDFDSMSGVQIQRLIDEEGLSIGRRDFGERIEDLMAGGFLPEDFLERVREESVFGVGEGSEGVGSELGRAIRLQKRIGRRVRGAMGVTPIENVQEARGALRIFRDDGTERTVLQRILAAREAGDVELLRTLERQAFRMDRIRGDAAARVVVEMAGRDPEQVREFVEEGQSERQIRENAEDLMQASQDAAESEGDLADQLEIGVAASGMRHRIQAMAAKDPQAAMMMVMEANRPALGISGRLSREELEEALTPSQLRAGARAYEAVTGKEFERAGLFDLSGDLLRMDVSELEGRMEAARSRFREVAGEFGFSTGILGLFDEESELGLELGAAVYRGDKEAVKEAKLKLIDEMSGGGVPGRLVEKQLEAYERAIQSGEGEAFEAIQAYVGAESAKSIRTVDRSLSRLTGSERLLSRYVASPEDVTTRELQELQKLGVPQDLLEISAGRLTGGVDSVRQAYGLGAENIQGQAVERVASILAETLGAGGKGTAERLSVSGGVSGEKVVNSLDQLHRSVQLLAQSVSTLHEQVQSGM